MQACLLDAGGDSSLQTVTDGEPLAHLKALKQSQGLKSCVLGAGELVPDVPWKEAESAEDLLVRHETTDLVCACAMASLGDLIHKWPRT